ncbi:MAG: hypothetical protein AAFZ91_14530 [Pseudomonadota bacterium]
MMRALLAGISAAFVLTACSTTSGASDTSQSPSALADVPRIGLSPQSLDPGECGLFIWSKTDVNRFAFFSKALSGTALFKPADTEMRLTQSRSEGTIFGQFTTDMGYITDDGQDIDLIFRPGETLAGGQRIDGGLITITDQAGWQTKLPVLGVRACQPE